MRVAFMVVGAMKSGTSTLARELSAHPEIAWCRQKEPGFFSHRDDWRARIDEYHALFEPPGLPGEASTMYTYLPEHPETPWRLHEYNRELRMIYLMRHPVDRALSHYAHRLVRRLVGPDVDHEVLRDPSYVNRSRYGVQLRPYLELFGPDQVLPLIFEEFVADQRATLAVVARFLGIDAMGFEGAQAHENTTTERSILSARAQRVRRHAVVSVLAERTPVSVREVLRRPFATTLETKPEPSLEVREALWRLLEDDAAFVETLLSRKVPAWVPSE